MYSMFAGTKRKIKMSPHLSHLNVMMAHRNYFRQNYLQIFKLATHTKIEDRYSGCKLATFRLERMAKCSYNFYLETKHQVLLICNENKEICVANLMIK